jgi:hypothetical protein
VLARHVVTARGVRFVLQLRSSVRILPVFCALTLRKRVVDEPTDWNAYRAMLSDKHGGNLQFGMAAADRVGAAELSSRTLVRIAFLVSILVQDLHC